MKRLSSASVVPASEARLRNLVRWRAEWDVEQTLRGAEDAGPGRSTVALPRRRRRGSSRRPPFPAVPGRIWLAGPSLVPDCPHPLYLVLAADAQDGWVRMVPLGQFAAPATDGELLLRHPAAELRVVCLWNARRLPVSILASGWPAGRLRADDLADLRACLDCRDALRPLPPALRDRTGPSISHPDDPRGRYLEEETGWIDALADAAVSGMDLVTDATNAHDDGNAHPLAAEPEPKPREGYGKRQPRRPGAREPDKPD